MYLNAEQAKIVLKYKNTKLKVTKTNLNIKFNKNCLKTHIIPKYAQIKLKDTSIAAQKTQKIAQEIRIKEEIKYLYNRKAKLNKVLYYHHVELYKNLHYIAADIYLHEINQHTQKTGKEIINKHNKKIETLTHIQHPNVITSPTHTFYPRLINNTNIQLTNLEIQTLNKGFKYNIPITNNNNISKEVINAEAAIKTIPTNETQNETRTIINKKLKNLIKNNNINKKLHIKYKEDKQNLKQIKQKLIDNNAIITKSDKGNTMVIINQHEYITKTQDFFDNNNIHKLNNDPTPKYTKEINNAINNSKQLFPNQNTNKFKQPNAIAPQFTGLPKIHKQGTPIRPLINYTTAPGYKIAKTLQKIIKNNINLINNHNIQNNKNLIEKLQNLNISPNYKLISFDVTNMYTNIPIDETIQILKENLTITATINTKQINELIYLLKTILKQNYFTFNNEYYTQIEGLAMGSPLSGLLADIYLNHYENKYILSTLNPQKHKIISYSRYVDDTFVIFDGTTRQIDILTKYINSINTKIKVTTEIENNNNINFLDLNITKHNNKLKYKIHRKPTTTDITIHRDSHHPHSQKMAAFNTFINRLINIPMDKCDYNNEINTIKQIAHANGYNTSIIDKLLAKKKKRTYTNKNTTNRPNDNTYTSINYTNLLPQVLQYEFKKHNINISFKTNNNIQNILKPKTQTNVKTYTGVYKLNCDNCNKFYIGQTGRSFYERFKEHKPKANTRSNYALHLIEENHNYTDFDKNCTPLHFCKKGRILDATEEYEIYKAHKQEQDNLLNDKLTLKTNPLYDTAIKYSNNNNNRKH